MSIQRTLVGKVGALAVAGTLMLGSQAGLAQDANGQFPVAIHAGTCDAPGTAVAGLGTLVRLPSDAPEAGDTAGAADVTVVYGIADDADDVEVDAKVPDLLGGPHIVAVFDQSGANIVACGSIGAYTYEEGSDLAFGLQAVGDSGYTGVVLIDVEDDKVNDAEVYMVGGAAPETATPTT